MRDTEKIALITVFAELGGFTHCIRHPRDYLSNPDRYPHLQNLLTPELYDMLDDWYREFRMCASDDYFDRQYGRMLWISFDLAGIRICKAIKQQHVGNKARVFFEKPWESPFRRYETVREVLEDGRLIVAERGKDW